MVNTACVGRRRFVSWRAVLRDQLKLLEDLQKVDLELHETEQILSALPEKIRSMKEDVARVETLLDAERARLEDVRLYKEGREEELRQDQDALGKTKAKLSQIRTSKEYMAVQREFDANKKMIGERDEEVSKLKAAIEETQESIAKHEAELEELRTHIAEEEQQTQARIQELEAQVAGTRQERERMADQIEIRLVRKYDQIRRKRQGLAVAPADDGVCSGCHMQLPPQLYNTLHLGGSIEHCPTCRRIVYIPVTDDN